eukprot:scaffold78589_cov54-Phaeocystis_antarctica.AAC.1
MLRADCAVLSWRATALTVALNRVGHRHWGPGELHNSQICTLTLALTPTLTLTLTLTHASRQWVRSSAMRAAHLCYSARGTSAWARPPS